jgi:hypothetical protein
VSLNGTTQYLRAANNAAFLFGAGDFTVESWIYVTSWPATNAQVAGIWKTTTGYSWQLTVYGPNTNFAFGWNGVASVSAPTGSLTLNTWYHVAASKIGSNIYLYLNGVQVNSSVIPTLNTSTDPLFIGANNDSATPVWYFPGRISNLRIVKGVGVYTGNFTVPAGPLSATQSASTNITAITGTQTSLLLNTPNSASFIADSSTNNFTVTNVGTAVASSNSPFLMYINSTTSGTSASISKSSGTVYGSSLSIQDSTATGGATWYAGPTSLNVSNNTGWIFNQLPIINMSNVSIDGGVTFSNDPI